MRSQAKCQITLADTSDVGVSERVGDTSAPEMTHEEIVAAILDLRDEVRSIGDAITALLGHLEGPTPTLLQ